MWHVLIVEDDEAFLHGLREQVLTSLASRARSSHAGDLATGLAAARGDPPDVVLLDVHFPLRAGARPDPRGGIHFLSKLPEIAPRALVIVLSGQDRRQAVDLLLSRRVEAYIFKDSGYDEVRIVLEKTLDGLDLRRSHRLLKEGVDRSRHTPMVASSPAMEELLAQARRVAAQDTSVLITGESGTGKEVLVRFIHENSRRAEGPLVALSCGALPEELVEAELFGALKGAYTGLDHDREGLMALARGGTLFLDELGELPMSLQPKLLRALQERSFRPLGAREEQSADFRLIGATHRDLDERCRAGAFREDLLFRIRVFPLGLPPLRERSEEIPFLVNHFIDRFNHEMGRRIRECSHEAIQMLKNHQWPGNIRELSNVIEYAFVVEGGDVLGPGSLPRLSRPSISGMDALLEVPTYREAMAGLEKAYLERALERAGWHLGRVSEETGLPRRTLQDRLTRHGIRIRERS